MQTSIWWVTRDLRQGDNAALAACAKDGAVLPVFVLDKNTMAQGAASRWRLQQGLVALDQALRSKHGTGLVILKGEADQVLPRLAQKHQAAAIHQSDWPCPDMATTQQAVRDALHGTSTRLCLHPGHLLVHPGAIRTGAGGSYKVFTPFARALRAHGPDRPVAPPQTVRLTKDDGLYPRHLNLAPDLHGGADVLARYALPAGEDAALQRLDDFLDDAAGYGDHRDRPDMDATSNLSDYLALGEISPRLIWEKTVARRGDAAHGADLDKFLSEICWREFAWHLLIDFPKMAQTCWRPEWDDFPWQSRANGLTAWHQGRTGIAMVDAGLREMRVTGRMHNRVRMVVASWLTKNLMVDWRVGLAHFQDSLTDWDPASNAMNWQWVAGCGPDASPFFRIFNPETQAQKFDAKARYRRRWLLGYDGADGACARAYFDAIPKGWSVPRDWRAQNGALAEGRKQALAAYQDFKAD